MKLLKPELRFDEAHKEKSAFPIYPFVEEEDSWFPLGRF